MINLAPTGIVPSRRENPHLPVTPAEIAADVERCFAAGARVFHLHARTVDGEATCRREVFADIVSRVIQAVPQAIIGVSTSGRRFPSYQDRCEVLDLEGELKPDLASLTPGSMNFPREASVNEPETIARLAAAMHERGIVPELEIFDFGMLDFVHYLIGKGILRPPFVFNLLLGSLGTLAATPLNLALLTERLPAGAFWSAAGIGRFQFAMNALGTASGGHVRTGLEDNLFLDEDRLRLATNAGLVERIARLAEAQGRPLATPEQARQLLGLADRDS
ncbi:MAG TPA: 3-keto-5-aminohexanoate cleavage protein [Candidatus Aminicenantes bacterium]|nr:3-keto-5-aminohexanoate cleavage protein [Candidatus Aminicenantes bacterium]